jgi:hypothetical protein
VSVSLKHTQRQRCVHERHDAGAGGVARTRHTIGFDVAESRVMTPATSAVDLFRDKGLLRELRQASR